MVLFEEIYDSPLLDCEDDPNEDGYMDGCEFASVRYYEHDTGYLDLNCKLIGICIDNKCPLRCNVKVEMV